MSTVTLASSVPPSPALYVSPLKIDAKLYALPRGGPEVARLNLQHRNMLLATGCLYLRTPALGDLSQFDNILDCATGTGIWVRDILLASDLGKKGPVNGQTNGSVRAAGINLKEAVKVEACDLSLSQFIDADLFNCLGKGRVDAFQHNVLESFPEDKIGKYDFIHQRLLRLAFEVEQWPRALANLKAALRPGGYIHLSEAASDLRYGDVPEGSDDEPAALRLANRVILHVDTKFNKHKRLHEELPAMLAAAGFSDLVTEHHRLPSGGGPITSSLFPPSINEAERIKAESEYRESTVEDQRQLFELHVNYVLELGGVEGCTTREEGDRLVRDYVELVESQGVWRAYVQVVARKPL